MALIDREQFDRINKYIYERDIKRERARASAPFAFLFMLVIGWGLAYFFQSYDKEMAGYLFLGTPVVVFIYWSLHSISMAGNKKSF
jgi:hypothetical protein